MSSRFNRALLLAIGAVALSANPSHARELKFCADPNNMPFSNDRGRHGGDSDVRLDA